MKFFVLILSIFSVTAQAAPKIKVVYPRAKQQIALVDSAFIFGSVTPGSKLSINGVEIPVYKEGGWLAFLDVSAGNFSFHLAAHDGGDSTVLDLPVSVGPAEASMSPNKFMPVSPNPSTKAIYFAADVFEFSFMASPGGTGWFRFDEREPIKMFESTAIPSGTQFSVFGVVHTDTTHLRDRVQYTGYYRFNEADSGVHNLSYIFRDQSQKGENPVVPEQCLDSLITVLPEFPPLLGMLSGQNHIIRTGPGLGYKLLYQPPGIMVNITGMRDNFYQIKLAQDVLGYINVDSVTLMPPGTTIPEGKISFITVDSTKDGIDISTTAGMKLPYEINESSSPWQLDIDIFGAVGNVDWIRYNTKNSLVKMVRWSQPQDHVFRLTVEIGKGKIWGYKASYDDNKLIIHIREVPKTQAANPGSFKGLKVVIDPGHSRDPGALGPTGLEEADANLWISHELRKKLEKKGAKVKMTRYGHEDIALYARPQMAESLSADLLISIHNNSLPDGINPFFSNGTSVYYYHPHSKALAEAVHDAMLKETGLPDHGLYYGNLALTRHTLSPAILVECTFIILPKQEALLKTNRFQKKCADAIVNGIEAFLRQNE